MGPGIFDHLLALTFAAVFPAAAIPLYARRRPSLLAGVEDVRRREYRDTVAWLGAMGLCTLMVWAGTGRSWGDLGLAPSLSTPTLVATGGLLLLLGFFAYQLRLVRTDDRARESVRRQLSSVQEYLPATASELRLFTAVALSAGIGEELFYRGFLLWYLGSALPAVGAVVISSVLFGLAHVMHGAAAAVRAGVLGIAFCALYLWTDALWIPMAVHIAIDWFSGRAAFVARH